MKTALRKLVDWWSDFWFGPISAYPISALRILFGIYLFIFLAWSLPFVPLLYSRDGVYSPLFVPDIAPSPAVAWLLYSITLALCIAFTVGYKTGIVTPLLTILFLYHFF